MNRITAVNRARMTSAMIAGMIVLVVAQGWATEKASFSESYADKLSCSGNSMDGYECNITPTGRFLMKASTTNTVDLSLLSADSDIMITFGNFTFEDFLGDANFIKTNATSLSATFVLTADVTDNNDNTITKKVGRVIFKAGPKGVSVSVSGITGETRFADFLLDSPIAADETVSSTGNDPGPFADSIDIDVQIDGGSTFDNVFTTVPLTGKAAEKIKIDRNGDEETLDTVRVHGRL